MVDSNDSNSGYFEIKHSTKPMKRKHYIIDDDEEDDEEDISGTEAMLRRRKQPKKHTTPLVYSSPTSKMTWTKNNELVIIKGILEYEEEKGISYGSDWDEFYGYVKDLIVEDFSKKQLINKVRKLKKRFCDAIARSKNGKEVCFTSSDDEQVFRLSIIIWGKNETESVSDEDVQDHHQPEEVVVLTKGSYMRKEEEEKCEEEDTRKEDEEKCEEEDTRKEDEEKCEEEDTRKDKDEKCEEEDMQDRPKDVLPCEENEPGSCFRRMEKEKECEEEEDGVDEFCVLQDALEAVTVFQSLGKNQKKMLCRNLKNLPVQRKKELAEEWKALLDEEMKLHIKKLTFSAKLANASAGVSA